MGMALIARSAGNVCRYLAVRCAHRRVPKALSRGCASGLRPHAQQAVVSAHSAESLGVRGMIGSELLDGLVQLNSSRRCSSDLIRLCVQKNEA